MAVSYMPTRLSSRYPDDIADPVDIAERTSIEVVRGRGAPLPSAQHNLWLIDSGSGHDLIGRMGPGILSGPAVPLSAQQADTTNHPRGPYRLTEQQAIEALAEIGNYRPRDRDYWIDVAETLDEAMDLPIPNGADIDIEVRLHYALNHLNSFPSLRAHLNVRPEWHGDDTITLTEQWVRDGVDSVQEGLLIEFWMNELREIIRIIPICVD